MQSGDSPSESGLGAAWSCTCGYRNFAHRWSCNRCDARIVPARASPNRDCPPRASTTTVITDASPGGLSKSLHDAAEAVRARSAAPPTSVAPQPPLLLNGTNQGAATGSGSSSSVVSQVGLGSASAGSVQSSAVDLIVADGADKDQRDKLVKQLSTVENIIKSLEAVAEDAAIAELLKLKQAEREVLKEQLQVLKPVQLQLKIAIAARIKAEKTVARLGTEERDLRVLLAAKQSEVAEATAELAKTMSVVESLELKLREEGVAALGREGAVPAASLGDGANGLGSFPPEMVRMFQHWLTSQAQSMGAAAQQRQQEVTPEWAITRRLDSPQRQLPNNSTDLGLTAATATQGSNLSQAGDGQVFVPAVL